MDRSRSNQPRPVSLIFALGLSLALAMVLGVGLPAVAAEAIPDQMIYQPGPLKPVDSVLKVKIGDPAPDFSLPSISGGRVSLSDYKGRKNVVLSFIPAAFTPVCSGQWPGYNIAREMFEENGAVMLGVSADNVPSLHAWVSQMGGVWFPVVSDFWPHGSLASSLGILRSDGTAERALFIIDTAGIIRYIDVHDINTRPDLGDLMRELAKLKQ